MSIRIGIDVGGTNTDAVLLDGDTVAAAVKMPTTADVTAGIVGALDALSTEDPQRYREVRAVMIGTTHFTNAVVEASSRLTPTGCLRIALPATAAVPPMLDWPAPLRTAIGGHYQLCHGGHEFNGRQFSPIDADEIKRFADEMARRGVRAIAISSVFSPVTAEAELQAADILSHELPDVALSLSHELGRIGLIERENAAIINASLVELAGTAIDAFHAALVQAGLSAPVYLSQNDGTVMDVDYARRYPVLTFASGPTNSMRGAAYLSKLSNCAVVDIGGTTTDVGIIVNGYPRPAGSVVSLGGVRTNFRMPDVLSLGLGGGSRVRGGPNTLEVGPDSVGYRLTEQALIFGGDVLTASDLAVAAGLAEFGDPGALGNLDTAMVREGITYISQAVATAVDRMRTSNSQVDVVLVGGGGVIVGDSLPGFESVLRPEHFAVANAIGAGIAQIGGEVDRVCTLAAMTREQALQSAREEAIDKAIAAGARPETVQVVEIDEVPLAYLPGNATRIRAKAVGDLVLTGGNS